MLKSFQVLSDHSIITDGVGNNRLAHRTPPSPEPPLPHSAVSYLILCISVYSCVLFFPFSLS